MKKGGGKIIRFYIGQNGQLNPNESQIRRVVNPNAVLSPHNENWSEPSFHVRWTTCVNIRWNGYNQHIYGTSLPDQFTNNQGDPTEFHNDYDADNLTELRNNLGFFMYGLSVTYFISLQACGDYSTWNYTQHHNINGNIDNDGYTNGCDGNPTSHDWVSRNRAFAEQNT